MKERVPTSSEGFLKVAEVPQSIPTDKRVALIRKGNELFNAGHFELAQKVFVTVRYSDGLIRLADRHWQQNEPLEAFRLYWLAGDNQRIEKIAKRMAQVIKKWMEE